MWILIFWIILMLVMSGFFSGSEMAFVSANKLGIEVLRNKGHKRGKTLARFYEQPKRFLGTMLVGNNIVLIIFTILMADLLEPWLAPYLGIGSIPLLLVVTLITTIIVLIFGEYIPKTIFRLFANELLYRLSYPLQFFKWILSIPTSIMLGLSNFLLKNLLGAKVEEADEVLTRVDLEHYINENLSEQEATVDKEILTNALNLSQVKVRDCMIPRMEIIAIEKNSSLDDLKETFISSRLSRIMILEGDVENIIGYIHHQKLISGGKRIEDMIMPITYIPEAMNVQDLMMKFIKEGTSIALVVDEYGATSGLITLEDILEEIFGEIEDEHDEEMDEIEQISEREFLFQGRTELSYINEKYPVIHIADGEYHTLSGYIVMTHQSIPEEGDIVTIDDILFHIISVTDTRIEKIRILLPESSTDNHSAPST